MKKSVASINKISWSVSKEYTAQLVLIDIYTLSFLFVFSSVVLFSVFCPSQVRSKGCRILHGVVVTIHSLTKKENIGM